MQWFRDSHGICTMGANRPCYSRFRQQWRACSLALQVVRSCLSQCGLPCGSLIDLFACGVDRAVVGRGARTTTTLPRSWGLTRRTTINSSSLLPLERVTPSLNPLVLAMGSRAHQPARALQDRRRRRRQTMRHRLCPAAAAAAPAAAMAPALDSSSRLRACRAPRAPPGSRQQHVRLRRASQAI